MQNRIQEALNDLIGMRLITIGRAVDMPTFGLTDDGGGLRALHLECPWRISSVAEIVLGHGDYWRPATAATTDEEFEAGKSGSRWRDVRRDALLSGWGARGLIIEGAIADRFGGFVLHGAQGYQLEVFADASAAPHDNAELWRLFVPKTDSPHFVVTTDGVRR